MLEPATLHRSPTFRNVERVLLVRLVVEVVFELVDARLYGFWHRFGEERATLQFGVVAAKHGGRGGFSFAVDACLFHSCHQCFLQSTVPLMNSL